MKLLVESYSKPQAVDVVVIFLPGAFLLWKVHSMYNLIPDTFSHSSKVSAVTCVAIQCA